MISPILLQSSDTAHRIELEYGWEILVDVSGRMQRQEAEGSSRWRSVRVGLSWNVQFDDLRDYMGAAWYRVRFELPAFRDTRHVLLKFGAVDYFCETYLNGSLVGTHEGGYTPFSFEVTSAIHAGGNELMMRVIDPPMDEAQNRALFPEMMYNEIPHGKQNWYVQNSGIWQGVRLELCPSIYIERLDIIPRVDGEFQIIMPLAGVGLVAGSGSLASQTELQVDIFDDSGRRVFQTKQPLDPSSNTQHVKGAIPNPRRWSHEYPALYAVQASLQGPVQYCRRTRFGFRSFEARDGKLFLNGKPFYMMAALDQDFYPETVHTPTSEAFVRDMMVKAKRLGVNVLRCHLKVAHPVYLDVADEVGMLIWTELPSWSDCWFPCDHFSSMAAIRAEKMFREILIRDWNHPCIVLQTIINESWGINLKDATQRAWLRATFDQIKGLLAPLGRLVVDNSPCEGNFHVKTDIEDFHQYYSMPDQVRHWDKWLDDFSNRPDWSFSPFGDAERTRHEPLLVSEFGNWGLPRLPEELPWWFHVAFGDREVTRPAGVLERFREYGLEKLFGTFNQMAEETQWHQFSSLKHEIESIRSYPSIQGYVVTGITDVHWEVNGLLDMWRNVKSFADELSALQHPDLIMCKLPRYSFWEKERIEIPVLLSHYSSADLTGAHVRWSTEAGKGGHFTLPSGIASGTVVALPGILLEMPEVVSGPATVRLEIEIRLRSGHRATENSYEVFVFPAAEKPKPIIAISDPRIESLRHDLLQAGYELAGEPHGPSLMIASAYDTAVASHLRNRGNVLIIADSGDAVPAEWPLRVMQRAGTELDGRWFSNFNWIRTDRRPFSAVAFTRILGFESAEVVPAYVIQNIAPADFDDVLSGATFGWLNKNSALAVQMQVGAGKLLLTTYRFDKYLSDPYARELLDSLVQYSSGSDWQPKLRMPITQDSCEPVRG